MFSEQELKARGTTVGASEVPAITGHSPWQGACDVYARKRRGKNLELPPLVESHVQEAHDTGPMVVGHYVEDAIAQLYVRSRRGPLELVHVPTVCHPRFAWASASLDRLCGPPGVSRVELPRRSQNVTAWDVECKAVGLGSSKHWEHGLPVYVRIQVQWQLGITGLPFADVAALVGTDFRVLRVYADAETFWLLIKIVDKFRREHILANVPPEPESPAERSRLVQAQCRVYQEELLDVTGRQDLSRQALRLAEVKSQLKALGTEEEALTTGLCEATGEHSGLVGPWGTFTWKNQRGRVDWRALAERDGPVDEDIQEEFRGQEKRTAKLTMKDDGDA